MHHGRLSAFMRRVGQPRPTGAASQYLLAWLAAAGPMSVPRPIVLSLGLAVLPALLVGCLVESSSPPVTAAPTVGPNPTLKFLWSPTVITPEVEELLATLPAAAGGLPFDGAYVIDDSLNAFSYLDDALSTVGKTRRDAVSVYRYSEQPGATIGATAVEGVDGGTLLKAFADTWNAPAVISRRTRLLGGTVGWELTDRRGRLTVVYRREDVVYLVSAPDVFTLDAILADMPPPDE